MLLSSPGIGIALFVKVQPKVDAATVAGVTTSSPAGFAPPASHFSMSSNARTCSAIVKSQWLTPRIARCTRNALLPFAATRFW